MVVVVVQVRPPASPGEMNKSSMGKDCAEKRKELFLLPQTAHLRPAA